MNLSALTALSKQDLIKLKCLIDSSPPGKIVGLGECHMPSGCFPSHTGVGLFKEGSLYAIFVAPAIRYSGQNRAMSALSNGLPLYFRDFGELILFMKELPTDTTPKPLPNEVPSPPDYDIDAIVNMNEITVPTKTAKTAPGSKEIQLELEKTIMGQDEAIEAISHHVALHIKKNNPKKPLSFVAWGPPGTGKSETAKILAKILTKLGPQPYAEVWVDLNQFTESHSVNRLIGAPPGYTGYDDTPIFEAVTHNPCTVFIFDELDKAHPEVLKVFMAILDEGRCASKRELFLSSEKPAS